MRRRGLELAKLYSDLDIKSHGITSFAERGLKLVKPAGTPGIPKAFIRH